MNGIYIDKSPNARRSITRLILPGLLILIFLTSCSVFKRDRIQVAAKPIVFLAPPPTPPAALLKSPTSNFSITVTRDEAGTWEEICQDWNSIGEEDAYNLDEFNSRYPAFLDHGGDACNWSVSGFTPQGLISLQNWLDRVKLYVRSLEDQNSGFRDIVKILTGRDETGEGD